MEIEIMDQIEARAKAARTTIAHVCGRAEVSQSTWYRARRGSSDLQVRTVRKLEDALTAIERERAAV